MDDKQKYMAEIESRMNTFGETLETITQKAKARKETRPTVNVDGIRRKHEDARLVFTDLQSSDGEKWNKTRSTMDEMVGDIDSDLREALAYYK